jgi:hypothetical protein
MLKAMEFIHSQFLQMAPIKQYNPGVYVHTCPPKQYHRTIDHDAGWDYGNMHNAPIDSTTRI